MIKEHYTLACSWRYEFYFCVLKITFYSLAAHPCKIVFSSLRHLVISWCISLILVVPESSWSQWSSWGFCSKDCGGGVRKRRRKCYTPDSRYGENKCRGAMVEYKICNIQVCKGNCKMNWRISLSNFPCYLALIIWLVLILRR